MKRKYLLPGIISVALLSACTSQESDGESDESRGMTETVLLRTGTEKRIDVKSKEAWADIYMKEWKAFKNDASFRKKKSHSEDSRTQSVDKFDLYLLDKYGTVSIGGETILSGAIISQALADKAVAKANQEDGDEAGAPLLKSAADCCQQGDPASYPTWHYGLDNYTSTYQFNQGVYKAYGDSWTDAGTFNYTAGGLTQFQKRIKHWYGTTWDDFNANWLSIRVNYYNSSRACLGADYDLNTNDDYVSERRLSSANRGVRSVHQVGHGSYGWLFSTAKGSFEVGQTCVN